jgi:hypothetical protein
VIQVIGFIHQLYIGKTEKQEYSRNTIPQTQCKHQRTDATQCKQCVGILSQGLYPFKTIIVKKVLRFDVQFINPPFEPKTNGTTQNHQSEHDPENS